jgi:Na+-transporting NADH:ubiquinone oxidoreductase subunit D
MAGSGKLKVPRKGYKLFKTKSWMVFSEGVWHNNPIFGMILGLCSTLAVTNLMANALVIALSVTAVLVVNSLLISSLHRVIPERVRIIAYMILVSSIVISIDMVLKIAFPDISKALGPYVALIITNCIIMERAEAFAMNNPVRISVVDAFGVGVGYTFSLMTISFFRELLGFGTVFGFQVVPESVSMISLLTIPPGAFFALGVFILVINTIRKGDGK